MTVMSEGLLLNLKYINMSREVAGFQALLTQLPETLFPPPLYFEPKPNLSKTLKGLLMRLVILKTLFFSYIH